MNALWQNVYKTWLPKYVSYGVNLELEQKDEREGWWLHVISDGERYSRERERERERRRELALNIIEENISFALMNTI